jgi:hypothetical protein
VLKKSISTKNGVILRDGKCLGDQRKSFVGHPDATLFCDLFPQVSFSTATSVPTNRPMTYQRQMNI